MGNIRLGTYRDSVFSTVCGRKRRMLRIISWPHIGLLSHHEKGSAMLTDTHQYTLSRSANLATD
jgi:hypothetical protein